MCPLVDLEMTAHGTAVMLAPDVGTWLTIITNILVYISIPISKSRYEGGGN